MHHDVDRERRQHPQREEHGAVAVLDESSRAPRQPPHQNRQEDTEPDEEGLAQTDEVPGPASTQEGGGADRRLVELDGWRRDSGRRPSATASAPSQAVVVRSTRPRPARRGPGRRKPRHAIPSQSGLRSSSIDWRTPPARPSSDGGGQERAHASLSHRPRAGRHPGGERGLGRVGEADHAVRPEQRAHDESERGQRGDAAPVEMPPEPVERAAPPPRSRRSPDPRGPRRDPPAPRSRAGRAPRRGCSPADAADAGPRRTARGRARTGPRPRSAGGRRGRASASPGSGPRRPGRAPSRPAAWRDAALARARTAAGSCGWRSI